MEQKLNPQTPIVEAQAVKHILLSKLLSHRIRERNVAWWTAPYDGGAHVQTRNAKINAIQGKINRDLSVAPLGSQVTKSFANNIMKDARKGLVARREQDI